MTFIVDANVIVKLFVDEPQSTLARELFSSSWTLWAPAHFLGEVGEVLLRRYRLGEVGDTQLGLALLALPRSVIAIPLGELVEQAFEIAITASASFYDALYVAATLVRDAFLITTDAKLRAAPSGSPWASRVVALEDWRMHEPPA
jgi:predicted nucleic acid-binding protein